MNTRRLGPRAAMCRAATRESSYCAANGFEPDPLFAPAMTKLFVTVTIGEHGEGPDGRHKVPRGGSRPGSAAFGADVVSGFMPRHIEQPPCATGSPRPGR